MTQHAIRIVMPFHLQTLAKIGNEVTLMIDAPVTHEAVIDAIEQAYPTLRGTIRDHVTKRRRPLVRFFACSQDVSHVPSDTPVPDPVLHGQEPFIIWGAIAGG